MEKAHDPELTLMDYLKEYEDWINKDLPIDSDWIEEINYISFLREEIDRKFHADPNSAAYAMKLDELDNKWQGQIRGNRSEDFDYDDKPEDVAHSTSWWWNVDKI
jgi:hypothetical protein